MEVQILTKIKFPIEPVEIEPTVIWNPESENDQVANAIFQGLFWPMIEKDLVKMAEKIIKLCAKIVKDSQGTEEEGHKEQLRRGSTQK